jgi:hypothetical protein
LDPTDGFLIALPLTFSSLVNHALAISAMGLVRAATLWFAVILGLASLFYFAR